MTTISEGYILTPSPADTDPYLPDRHTSLAVAVREARRVLDGETWLMGRDGDDMPAPPVVWVCTLTRGAVQSEDGRRWHVVYTVEPVCYLVWRRHERALEVGA